MELSRLKKIKAIFASGDYSCDENGTVYSHKRGKRKVLKPRKVATGYIEYCFSFEKDKIYIRAHQAIYIFFKPDSQFEALEIDHKNGNKHDNSLRNLELVTQQENAIRSWKTRKKRTDGKQYRTLTPEIIREIRFLDGFESRAHIARKFGIDTKHLRQILRRDIWKDI